VKLFATTSHLNEKDYYTNALQTHLLVTVFRLVFSVFYNFSFLFAVLSILHLICCLELHLSTFLINKYVCMYLCMCVFLKSSLVLFPHLPGIVSADFHIQNSVFSCDSTGVYEAV